MGGFSPHTRAALQALLVTFLWSTSWVIIKLGLRESIPPLLFAGLRYGLAFVILLAWVLRRTEHRAGLRALSRRDWLALAALGLIYYTVTQGTQFLALKYLPAATLNLLLSFSAVLVALLSLVLLREKPAPLQWGGLGLSLLGALVFFVPVALPGDMLLGMGIGLVGVATNAVSSLLGRSVNRQVKLAPVVITVASMGIGAAALLAVAITTEGFPPLRPESWLMIGWLAVVNTAFAFTLWNVTLRTLSALESSIINNAMMIQIPLLAWLFLGEGMTAKQVIGLALAALGILAVQLRRLPVVGRVPVKS
ncbi:MAG: EamA family transporter [Chloroflexi bacterium]|nr:EamA family transporter [Chloroflexota bacterium]